MQNLTFSDFNFLARLQVVLVNQVTTKVVGQNQSKLVPALGNYSVMFNWILFEFITSLYLLGQMSVTAHQALSFRCPARSKCPDLYVRREEETSKVAEKAGYEYQMLKQGLVVASSIIFSCVDF
jgi:hypothetical protein